MGTEHYGPWYEEIISSRKESKIGIIPEYASIVLTMYKLTDYRLMDRRGKFYR